MLEICAGCGNLFDYELMIELECGDHICYTCLMRGDYPEFEDIIFSAEFKDVELKSGESISFTWLEQKDEENG